MSIEQQIQAFGATWLDRRLIRAAGLSASTESASTRGFGTEVVRALKARLNLLVSEGLAVQSGQRIVLARDLLTTLHERDVNTAGESLASSTGKRFHHLQEGDHAQGIFRRSIQLSSGKFALIENEKSFSLAPWKPVIETRLGRRLSVTIRGSSAEWRFSVQKALAV